MGMTDEEKFRFDLTGFLVRPSILTPDETAEIADQITRIYKAPQSLPPEHRTTPGGPSQILVDHPKIIEVLHEIIGPLVRLEISAPMYRERGQSHGQGLHQGGPMQADPLFGYRVLNGRIYAGL